MMTNRSQVTAGFQRCHKQDTAPWGVKQGGRPHSYPAAPYPRAARKIRRSSWELKRLKGIDKLYLLLECNSKNLQRDFPASIL